MAKALFTAIFAALVLAGCTQQPPAQESNGTGISAQLVEQYNTIKVEYEGRLESGEVFDSSARQGKPLEFAAGAGRVIKGFDEAVLGMRLNGEKTVTIAPEKAYGQRDERKVVDIPKAQFTNWATLEVGMPVNSSEGPNGKIIELKEDSAVVDFNHELAGKTLIFWIKVVEIRKT